MYCRKCGKSIPGDSLFCPYCGVPTDPETRTAKNGVRSLIFKIMLPLILVLAVLVCVIMVVKLSGPGRNDTAEEAAPPQSTLSTLSPETAAEETEPAETVEGTWVTDDSDPWIHVDTMEEAEAALGFGLEGPEMVADFEEPWINIAPDCSNLWVSYHKYTPEHDPMYYDKIITVGRHIYIVKYPCTDGLYYVSSGGDEKLIQVDGNDVVLVMENNEVVEANWAADGYAYTASFENTGLTAYTVVPVISQIH